MSLPSIPTFSVTNIYALLLLASALEPAFEKKTWSIIQDIIQEIVNALSKFNLMEKVCEGGGSRAFEGA